MCQRPRCWYFRNGMGLLPITADGKSMVVEGDNRYAAILGNDGPAYFVSPSTIAPVLIAYGAKIRFYSAKSPESGVRELPLEKFFVIPKAESELEHDLRPGEMVLEIVVPPPARNLRVTNYEVRQKAAFDWPLATATVALEMNGEQVSSARVVLGHVAPIPWISSAAAQALVGKNISEESAQAAAAAALSGAKAAPAKQIQDHAGESSGEARHPSYADSLPQEGTHDAESRFRTLRHPARGTVSGAALEGTVHRSGARPFDTAFKRWFVLVHAHPDLYRPGWRACRAG